MWSWNRKVRIELLLSCIVSFCTQCSTELDESWNACPNCGNIRPDRPSDQIMLREGSTAEPEPGDQERKCLNCGRNIEWLWKKSPILGAIDWFLGLFVRPFLSAAVKAEEDAQKIAPKRCICGLPVFSDPKNMKKTNDLFWISKESFKPNHWSNIEIRGLFLNRMPSEYAFRIVNDVQRLDTTVQFKIIGSKIFVQQQGRNVVLEKYVIGGDLLARITLTNEYGVQHEYFIIVSPDMIFIETKKPNGFTERRSWLK